MTDDPTKRAAETVRRMKLLDARRAAGLVETSMDADDEEYDAPPKEWWDQDRPAD